MTDRLELLDYYTLLGLEPGASGDDIRRAFHTFALKFHPDNHSSAEPAKLARATQIFRRGAEAYRVLLDPGARKRYDEGLSKGELRLSPERARASKAPSAAQRINRKAHPFWKKAQAAMKREDWQTAKLNLNIAKQHDPDNPTIAAALEQVQERIAERKRR